LSKAARVVPNTHMAVPWVKLFTCTQSSGALQTFHNHYALARASQVCCCDQPFDAGSNDNGWVRHQMARVLSICSAAKAPGAAITPPPGCAPLPHSHRFFTGVAYRAHPEVGRWNSNWSSDSSP
jgi:hypothetical protein